MLVPATLRRWAPRRCRPLWCVPRRLRGLSVALALILALQLWEWQQMRSRRREWLPRVLAVYKKHAPGLLTKQDAAPLIEGMVGDWFMQEDELVKALEARLGGGKAAGRRSGRKKTR